MADPASSYSYWRGGLRMRCLQVGQQQAPPGGDHHVTLGPRQHLRDEIVVEVAVRNVHVLDAEPIVLRDDTERCGQGGDLRAEVARVVQAEQVGATIGQLVDVPERVVAGSADLQEASSD